MASFKTPSSSTKYPPVLRLTGLAVALAITQPAIAQVTAPNDESPYLDDLPVVLSASRLAQSRVDAPGSVTVLDREQIRASGLREISDLLRLVPGFMSTYAEGSYPVAGYHGLTRDRSNQMLVLVDGRSVYSPYLLGGIEWNQLGVAIDDIERIEVFRGTNAAAYGANAFLGVVNITTRSALGSPQVSAMVQSGEGGVRDISAATTLRAGDLGMRLRASEQRGDGFEGFFDSRRLKQADLRGDLTLGGGRSLEAHLGSNRANVERGYAGDAGDPPRWQKTSQDYGLLRLRQTLAAEEELSLSYYHQQESGDDYFGVNAPIPPALQAYFGWPAVITIPLDFAYTASRDDIELQHIKPLSNTTRIVWGAGGRRDTLESPIYFYNKGEIETTHLRGFANLEWRLRPAWLLNAGLMVENTSLSGTKSSPRLALNYHPAQDQAVRIAWSRGYRAPTPFEEMSDNRFMYDNQLIRWRYQPAGDLDPERITAVELGYVWDWKKYKTSLDVRAYDEKVDKLIRQVISVIPPGVQLDPVSLTAITYGNGDSAHMYGLEYQLSWRPARESWISLSQNFMNIVSDNERLATSAPHHSTVLSASHRWNSGFGISAHAYIYGPMRWGQSAIERIPTYRRVDVRVSYAFNAGRTRNEVFVQAQNIGPNLYEYKPRYELDRRILAGVRLEF